DRRRAGILASPPQPSRRRPRAARLYTRAARSLAQASERHAMSRFGYVIVTYLAVLAAGGLAFFHPAPRLIWNATASTPTGLYVLRPVGQLRRLELVAVRPPEPIASYLADGGFLPKGVPLLKHLLALPGQTVCRAGDAVTIDHVSVGAARD